jgi:cholesterol transport system auxiliary component
MTWIRIVETLDPSSAILTRRNWLLRAAVLGLGALGACTLTREAPIKQTFLLDTRRPAGVSSAPLPGALMVAPVRVAEAYAGKPMVFRTEEYRYESDFYNEYFIAPRDIVTQRLIEWLQAARLYEAVLPAVGPGPRAGLILDAIVTEMHGDLRDPAQPKAVLAMQCYLTHPTEQPLRVLFSQEVRHASPMADSSATSLAAGLSSALAAVLTQLEQKLRAAAVPAIPVSGRNGG